MNVIYLGTAAEVVLLEAYRRSCASHQEQILMFADAAVERCASGHAASASGCARSVAPGEPARPRPARLTLVKS